MTENSVGPAQVPRSKALTRPHGTVGILAQGLREGVQVQAAIGAHTVLALQVPTAWCLNNKPTITDTTLITLHCFLQGPADDSGEI